MDLPPREGEAMKKGFEFLQVASAKVEGIIVKVKKTLWTD